MVGASVVVGGAVVVGAWVVVGVVAGGLVVVVVAVVGGEVAGVVGAVGGTVAVVGGLVVGGRGRLVDVVGSAVDVGRWIDERGASAATEVSGSVDSIGSDEAGTDDSTVDAGHSSGIELSGGALVADADAAPTEARATATPQLTSATATIGVIARPERRMSTRMPSPDASAIVPKTRIGPTDPPEIGRSQMSSGMFRAVSIGRAGRSRRLCCSLQSCYGRVSVDSGSALVVSVSRRCISRSAPASIPGSCIGT